MQANLQFHSAIGDPAHPHNRHLRPTPTFLNAMGLWESCVGGR